NLPHQDLRLIHAGFEPRIEVPHNRRSKRPVNARIDRRRARRHHQPHRGSQFTDQCLKGAFAHVSEPRLPITNLPKNNFPAFACAPQPTYWLADRKSTRLNSSHGSISYAVFCLKKKKNKTSI